MALDLIKYAEQDLSPSLADAEALRRMRCCPWGYGFDVHRRGTAFAAALYAKHLIWC